MRVVEIFESIDGEGIRAGFPVTFIRLHGCNLNCSYCDSRYACDEGWDDLYIEDILKIVQGYGHKRITLTGGEPLIHPDVRLLIQELLNEGYYLNIETNGSVDISPYVKKRNCVITLDYKCPSSDMEDKMLLDNLTLLRKTDVLKFVVGTEEDLMKAKEIVTKYELEGKCHIFLSPVFDKIEAKRLVEFMLEEHLELVRVQLQMHKFIWNPEMRGV